MGRELQRRVGAWLALAALLAAFQPGATLGQTASPPVRVTAVSESAELPLYGKRGTASAPPRARIVTAALALDAATAQVSTDDLRLLLNGTVYRCEAIGSAKHGFCPAPASLARKGSSFDGHCFTGNIGGMEFEDSELAAAFILPQGLDLGSAQLMARFLSASMELDSREPAKWPWGFTARIVEVKKHDVGWLIDVEVGNTTDKTLPLNPDDLRLGRSTAGRTHWRLGQNFLHDRTTPPADGGNGERVNSLSLTPGASRTVRLTFINVAVGGGDERWMLGYFTTAALPLKP